MGGDPFNLDRFLRAQEDAFDRALGELKRGKKQSHWMWFIFPQIDGLGSSPMTKEYAIKSLDEARAYLEHQVLGQRLTECSEAVLAVEGRTALEIMGRPDDLKLKSSMTLFERADANKHIFAGVLEKYYAGQRDERTLEILRGGQRPPA